MCAIAIDKPGCTWFEPGTVLFRSYMPPNDARPSPLPDFDYSKVTITEAARATSAAPTYLPQMIIQKVKFWDGGLLNNNPIDQVWSARYDLAIDSHVEPNISCVVSIGTTISKQKRVSGWSFLNKVTETMSFATNTEAKHHDFQRNNSRCNLRKPKEEITQYFRFNAPLGDTRVDLADYRKIPLLKQKTEEYLETNEVQIQIKRCAELLAR
jgi:predicted acylesterase/phospholipase RssA